MGWGWRGRSGGEGDEEEGQGHREMGLMGLMVSPLVSTEALECDRTTQEPLPTSHHFSHSGSAAFMWP